MSHSKKNAANVRCKACYSTQFFVQLVLQVCFGTSWTKRCQIKSAGERGVFYTNRNPLISPFFLQADQVGEKVAELAVTFTTKLRGLFLVDDLSESLKVGL